MSEHRAPLLEFDRVTLAFGGVVALSEVTFDLYEGEILGLIGPNGAGKTTAFNVMSGIYKPTSGQVRFRGHEISGRKPFHISHLGISRTFQNIRLFPEMTAIENVMVAVDSRHKTSVPGALFRLARVRLAAEELPPVTADDGLRRAWQETRRAFASVFGLSRHAVEESRCERRALELLDLVGVADRANEIARNLPYGYQRRLEIARALGTEPTLLCLDEPAAGFNPSEKQDLLELIRRIRDIGHTILLIEHDMRLVMNVTDRIVVLEFGRKIADGQPASVARDPKVVAAYLGENSHDA